MNSKEKSMIVEALERLARIEERSKHTLETLQEIKKHMETINEELGSLDDRVSAVEALYHGVKVRYEKMSFYWKLICFIVSPIGTFLVIAFIKSLLGFPPFP